MMNSDQYIELPLLLAGQVAVKLKVLYYGKGVLALEKPEGILIDAYPWYPKVPSIVVGLKQQVGKGLLPEYDLKSIYGVYALEPEVSGVALVANSKESSRYLRNEFGSDKMLFRFVFLSKSQLDNSLVECDLPIAKHYTEERVVISNKTGKKCKTLFRLLKAGGGYQVWEAQATYLRMHQVRIHAMEVGIAIVGDDLYRETNEEDAFVPQKNVKKEIVKNISLSEGICLHLSSVEWEEGNQRFRVDSELPEKMKTLFEELKIGPIGNF